MSAHRSLPQEKTDENQYQPKNVFSAKILTQNQNVYIHIKVPKRWLSVLAAILGAWLTSTPLTQLIEVLAPLLK
jgi:hypothetical protein